MDKPAKILLIQLKRAGDVLVSTPAAEAVKKRFPESRLDFLTLAPFAPLLENNPAIDRVQIYNSQSPSETIRRIRAERYDWVFDFQSSPRSALLVLCSGARRTAGYDVPFWGRVYGTAIRRPGGKRQVSQGKLDFLRAVIPDLPDASLPKLVLKKAENDWGMEIIAPSAERPPVGLIPTHRRDSRRWHAESFVALARRLHHEGAAVWLFWGPGEKEYVQAIQREAPQSKLIPDTTLRQMAALLKACRLVVTNDNGPMHTAVAVGTPTITIYGPTEPSCWNPGGPNHTVVQARDVPCLGCNLNECPFNHECMTHVTADQVLDLCRAKLSLLKESRIS